MPDSLSFAEVGLLHLDRALRELDGLHDALRVADEHLLQAESQMSKATLPPSIKIINENIQSIGITLVNTNDGLVLKVTHRGSESEHLLGPGNAIELGLNGE